MDRKSAIRTALLGLSSLLFGKLPKPDEWDIGTDRMFPEYVWTDRGGYYGLGYRISDEILEDRAFYGMGIREMLVKINQEMSLEMSLMDTSAPPGADGTTDVQTLKP